MKIIDLLIKRANGEKMPIKIKYDLKEYIYSGYDYKINDVEKQNDDDYNLWNNLDMYKLNNEVEIIEEPKKIEKIDEILMIDNLIPPYGENEYKAWKNIINQQNKINELIDVVNKLKGEK